MAHVYVIPGVCRSQRQGQLPCQGELDAIRQALQHLGKFQEFQGPALKLSLCTAIDSAAHPLLPVESLPIQLSRLREGRPESEPVSFCGAAAFKIRPTVNN